MSTEELQQDIREWFKSRRCYAEDCTCDIDQPCWYHMSVDEQDAERTNSLWEFIIEPWLEERGLSNGTT